MPQPFNAAVMTDDGADLITRAQAGTIKINFTRIAVGNGTYTEEEKTLENMQKATDLKYEKNSYTLSGVEIENKHSVKITALVTNQDPVTKETLVEEGYYINEVGLFAKPEGAEDTEEVLYSIAVTSGDKGDFMPPYNGFNPAQITQDFYATVDNSANITIETTGAAMLADDADRIIKEHVQEITGEVDVEKDGTLQAQINALKDSGGEIFKDNEGAGLHNSLYRGKNLGTELTEEQKTQIAAGTFEDLWVGDYWVIGGVTWRIAHFDYWLHCGDTECTKHHIVIVPDTNLYTAKMNDSNITTGAYVGSVMYTTNLETAKTTIANAFGSDNILTHRVYLPNATKATSDPTYESSGSYYDSTVELMNERMVYGADIFHNVQANGVTPMNYTIDKTQLALFRLDPSKICNRANWWLRDVVSSSFFALVDGAGGAGSNGASYTGGVRPAFGITA